MSIKTRSSLIWSSVKRAWVSTARYIGRGIKLSFVLAIIYVVAVPVIQPALLLAWAHLPATGIAVAVLFLVYHQLRRKLYLIGTLTLVLGLSACSGLVYLYHSGWFIENEMASALRPQPLSDLPDTVNNRLLGRATALQYAGNANHDNRLRVGQPHLTASPNGDKVSWQVPLHYTVWYGAAFGSSGGLITIDAGQTSQKVDNIDHTLFRIGDESWLTKAVFRLLHPLSRPGNVVYWRQDNGQYCILISYVSYKPTLGGGMIPILAGVMQVNASGTIANYSVEEAAESFPGIPLYPAELARQYAEAYADYKLGVSNYLITQKDLLRISEDPQISDDDTGFNRLPYYQVFQGLGLELVVPLEPNGKADNTALKEILLFDGTTGAALVYKVSNNPPVVGPKQALRNVVNADSQSDWGQFLPIESKLAVKGSNRYWLYTVVNRTTFAHIMLVLVDGFTLEAHKFLSADELHDFLAREKPQQ